MITPADMEELKRMFTNSHSEDRARLQRLIKGISDFQNHIRALKSENEALKAENAQLREQAASKKK